MQPEKACQYKILTPVHHTLVATLIADVLSYRTTMDPWGQVMAGNLPTVQSAQVTPFPPPGAGSGFRRDHPQQYVVQFREHVLSQGEMT